MSYAEMVVNIVQQTRATWNNYNSEIAKRVREILSQRKPLEQLRLEFEQETSGEMFQRELNASVAFQRQAYRTYLILCVVTESFDVDTLCDFSKTDWEMYGRWIRIDKAIERAKALRKLMAGYPEAALPSEPMISAEDDDLTSIINAALGFSSTIPIVKREMELLESA